MGVDLKQEYVKEVKGFSEVRKRMIILASGSIDIAAMYAFTGERECGGV
jgi:hypothetical protein